MDSTQQTGPQAGTRKRGKKRGLWIAAAVLVIAVAVALVLLLTGESKYKDDLEGAWYSNNEYLMLSFSDKFCFATFAYTNEFYAYMVEYNVKNDRVDLIGMNDEKLTSLTYTISDDDEVTDLTFSYGDTKLAFSKTQWVPLITLNEGNNAVHAATEKGSKTASAAYKKSLDEFGDFTGVFAGQATLPMGTLSDEEAQDAPAEPATDVPVEPTAEPAAEEAAEPAN